ncbi:hypothetical protein [Proteiniphilum sp.]|uniref:hypothetical protein n=1 Tax=Proteiniphilum sp. TaxID=1926877 RepID=UPI002B21360C|nr:hypothetical protein [Proteiniphilum sp.]MEA4916103.1 hypothetical protein [Proteiniphilum sp.]
MKNLIYGVCIWMSISFSLSGHNPAEKEEGDIIIKNGLFRLVVGSNAIAKSLTLTSTGEECLMQEENVPLFSVTQERPYHNEIKLSHPNKRTTFQANSIHREGDKLIVGFELVPYQAVIQLKETPAYVGFSLEGFIVAPGTYPSYLKITPPPATELCLLQLPVRNHTYFGEWLNVSWDENVAVNVLATDENAYIDFEKHNNYKLLTATALKEIKFEGTGAALIVCKPEDLLDNIAQIEEDFDLPKGVESRRSNMINASYYWSPQVNPGNVDQHIRYAKMGGFRAMNLYYPCFEGFGGYDLIGNYEIDRKLYPNGKEDLKKMLDKIKAAGITPGVHFLHSHIGRNSQYVTPIPDHRLNLTRTFTLSEDIAPDDTEIFVEQNPKGTVMADGCRVLKVGSEFITYENYTITPPYKFIGCTRGVDQTTVNGLSKGSIIGIVDVSEFGATSLYIDQRTSLQDEIAEKIADIYDAGFQFIYFDGSEGVNPPFGINVALAQYRVFKRLKPEPLFAEGAAKSHFSWHMLSGGNAFDVFAPEVLKEEVRKWPGEEAPRMKQDFTRINFGWLGYVIPDENTVGTQPDMLEYVTSMAAGWDCPVSIHAYPHILDAHPKTKDNMEVFRRWEEVRARNWLTDTQKKMLQNVEQEHHLLLDEQGQFELVAYDQISDVAGGSRDIRAFTFKRKGEYYVVYWHISGDKKLQLPLKPSDITLYEKLDKKKKVISATNNSVTVPASNRHYIKTNKLTTEQLSDAFKSAQIID